MDDAQIADGGAQPNAQQPNEQQPDTPSTDKDVADVLYPQDPALPPVEVVPDAVKELRAADRDRVMFTAQQAYADVPVEDNFVHPEISDIDRARAGAEVRELFADNGLTPEEARQVLDIGKSVPTRPDDATLKGWAEQSYAQLHEQYGDETAAVLDLTRKFIARDPRTVAILEQSGLGSHPDVVRLAVEAARRARARGQI